MNALSPDPTKLSRRARDLIDAGRVSAAKPLIAALCRVAPDLPEAAELEARCLQHEGRMGEAETILGRALTASPDSVALLLCRADLRLQSGEALGGADDAAAAVIAAPSSAPAKALLGVALIELGRFEEAVVCLRAALAAVPGHPAFREALAQAQERAGGSDAALVTLEQGIAMTPGSVALRVAAIMTAVRRSDHATAIRLGEAARVEGVVDARVFGLLGHVRSIMGQEEEAARCYQESLKLVPEDDYVRYLVAASGQLPSVSRAPPAYVETVFDGYAECFDTHLMSLGYRIPGLVRQALLEHLPDLRRGDVVGPVLDLGCGTGLIGLVLSDLPFRGLVGVDLSGKMLAQARTKRVYAELRQQDIESVLCVCNTQTNAAAAQCWAVIVAADSLCYFGDLGAVMIGAFGSLHPGGLFVFSTEELTDAGETAVTTESEPWRLGAFGRYAHRASAIEALARTTGFAISVLRRETLRRDRGADVQGIFVVLARPA